MRWFNRTVILAICAILVPAVFWPMLNLTVPSNAAAQSGPAVAPTTATGEEFAELNRTRIELILAQPIPKVEIFQIPLREVLVNLKDMTGINMYFDLEELGDTIDPDVPVDVQVAADSMTYKTLINRFILEPNDLVFVIEDNFLTIMSYDKHLATPEAVQLVVYNCRDLLVGIPDRPAAGAPGGVSGGESATGSEGGFTAPGGTGPAPGGASTKTEILHQFGGGFGSGGFGPGGPGEMPVQEEFSDIGAREQQLADLIRMTIRHGDYPWDDGSSPNDESVGFVEAFNGMLVVRGLPEMHEQVRQLLRLLRESTKEKDWPAELGDWPHKKRVSPPPKEEEEEAMPEQPVPFF